MSRTYPGPWRSDKPRLELMKRSKRFLDTFGKYQSGAMGFFRIAVQAGIHVTHARGGNLCIELCKAPYKGIAALTVVLSITDDGVVETEHKSLYPETLRRLRQIQVLDDLAEV